MNTLFITIDLWLAPVHLSNGSVRANVRYTFHSTHVENEFVYALSLLPVFFVVVVVCVYNGTPSIKFL